MTTDGERLVRAAYTGDTITVYQAYAPQIADAAMARRHVRGAVQP